MGEWVKHAMSAHDIYRYFADGRGTSWLDDGQDATRAEWDRELDRARMIRKQGELIRAGWQGSASDGAFGAAQPLAESAEHGATLLSRAEDLLDRQSGSFHRAANSVNPVPEEPPGMDLGDPAVVFGDYEAKVKDFQSQVQHNFDVYGVYDGASEYNETNMPGEYSTINHAGGSDISVTSGDSKPSGTGDYIEVSERERPRSGGDSGPYGGYGGPGPGGSPVSGPPVGGPPVSGPLPNPSLPQQTTPSTYVPPSVSAPGPYPPHPYQPPPGGPGRPGYGPGVPGGGFPSGSPGPRTGYGPGAGYGPRGGYGGGPGSPGGNPGPGARGPGPGPTTGAIPAEEAAGRRAAAAAAAARGAAPGGLAGAPMGAGRGKGDEDEEHQRKVLIETDGEDIFGSDVLTAPQVIGDDEYEDD